MAKTAWEKISIREPVVTHIFDSNHAKMIEQYLSPTILTKLVPNTRVSTTWQRGCVRFYFPYCKVFKMPIVRFGKVFSIFASFDIRTFFLNHIVWGLKANGIPKFFIRANGYTFPSPIVCGLNSLIF